MSVGANPGKVTSEQNGQNKSEKPPSLLVWMDMEMTGLDPDRDVIIEIATLITDSSLNIVAYGPELVIQQDPKLFDSMDDWNKEHHSKSGLWQRVIQSDISLAKAEKLSLEFIKQHTGARESPLCGNSIWQDRRFLAKQMPTLERYLHYRIIDVSSIKELGLRWYPALKYGKKKGAHRALDDIKESVEELRFYRQTYFKEAKDLPHV